MDLLQMFTNDFTSESAVNSLAEKTGASGDQISGLLNAALPQLLGSMTTNASSQEGALSLLGALDQHTETAPVADQIANADTEDGGKILEHIFGSNTNNTISALSGNSGLSPQMVGLILSAVAPALLSGLSGATQTAAQQAQQAQQVQPVQQTQQSSGKTGLFGMLSSLFGKKPAQQTQQVQTLQPTQQQSGSSDLLGMLLNVMAGK